jgi:3-oxoacyl-[acyl-carrier protein] reductase
MVEEPLVGEVAIVTGCGRIGGLGRGIALALADAGADVAVTDVEPGGTRNAAETGAEEAEAGWRGLESLVEEIQERGRRAVGLVGDVSRRDDVIRMVQEAWDELGRIDILVSNAAAPHGADRTWTWEVPEEAWDLVMGVNLKGAFLMCSAVVPRMLERNAGRIIIIASDAGWEGTAKHAAYCASKFGLRGLTQSLAAELAPHGITVNAICPGLMDTARQTSRRTRVRAGEDLGVFATDTPVGRMGQSSDVARLTIYLADPASDFVTGQSISVNGGAMMH